MSVFNKNIKCILIITLLLGFISCGIENGIIPLLKTPVALSTSSVSGTFTFESPVESSEVNLKDFRGFEIYYKFYSSPEAATEEMNLASIESVQQKNFWRLTRSIDDKPLIIIPDESKEEIFQFTIDFSLLEDVFISSEPDPGAEMNLFPVFRSVKNEANEFKNFSEIEEGDADIDIQQFPNLDINYLYITVYVFSYGIYNWNRELYSIPRCLNTIELVLN